MSFGLELWRLVKKVKAPFDKIGLKNKTFSIISNNCFGGFIYDRFGLQYASPTVGLSFPSKDYLKFLKNLEHYLNCQIEDLPKEQIKNLEFLKVNNLNIDTCKLFKLDDLEVNCLHYPNPKVANEKWKRRAKRVNLDNLLVKMNDQNCATVEDMKEFLKLPFKNKLLFTANPYFKNSKDPNVIFMSKYEKLGYVKEDYLSYSKYVKIKKILNNL